MAYHLNNIFEKIQALDSSIEKAWIGELAVPEKPGRDLLVCMPEFHPDKKGLSYAEGQARLLHDLASIELQALELGFRSLQEFRDAPETFRHELVEIIKSESFHLSLCLQGIEDLGFHWGHWPVHTLLWNCVSAKDSLLDRILIVHRYLEGSGLDAGDTFTRRLSGIARSKTHHIVETIFKDEMGHVQFGSDWYRRICALERLNCVEDFTIRMNSLKERLPKRIEKISQQLRQKAGFSLQEIEYLEELRKSKCKY